MAVTEKLLGEEVFPGSGCESLLRSGQILETHLFHPTAETLWITVSILFIWMQRLSRSLSRLETQDIKTQPQINHDLISYFNEISLDLGQSLMSVSNPGVTHPPKD